MIAFLLQLSLAAALQSGHRHHGLRHLRERQSANLDNPSGTTTTATIDLASVGASTRQYDGAIWSSSSAAIDACAIATLRAVSDDVCATPTVDGVHDQVIATSGPSFSPTQSTRESTSDTRPASILPRDPQRMLLGGYPPQESASDIIPLAGTSTRTTPVFAAPNSSSASIQGTSFTTSNVPSPSDGDSPSGGKRGLGYNTASLTNVFAGKGMTWAYNWAPSPGGQIVAGAEYVPMLWGSKDMAGWGSAAATAIASGSQHALSFNEPDIPTQSNIDPQTAAKGHIQYMNPLVGQLSIVSPAISNGVSTPETLMGIGWLQSFFDACAGQCAIDVVAYHWYGDASNLDGLQQYSSQVIQAATAVNVSRVWLTEFGASGSDADVALFIGEAVAYLDSVPEVERYAYFMCSDGILVSGDTISPLGEAYVD